MSSPPDATQDDSRAPRYDDALDDAFTVERWVPPFRSPNAHIPPRPRKEAPPLGMASEPLAVLPLGSRASTVFSKVERDVPLLPAPAAPGRSLSPWGLIILAALICLDLIGAALLHYQRNRPFADSDILAEEARRAPVRDRPALHGTIGVGETCDSGSSHPSSF